MKKNKKNIVLKNDLLKNKDSDTDIELLEGTGCFYYNLTYKFIDSKVIQDKIEKLSYLNKNTNLEFFYSKELKQLLNFKIEFNNDKLWQNGVDIISSNYLNIYSKYFIDVHLKKENPLRDFIDFSKWFENFKCSCRKIKYKNREYYINQRY